MENIQQVADFAESMKSAVHSVFVGSDEAVHFAILGLASSLHVLIEDVPGVGKTTLARTVSATAGLSFSRIQFTPDMLPADVLGVNVWNPTKNDFYFKSGAINAQCILADELNRTSPRTQTAFLEAMQEGQVTVDGVTRPLPKPFFLIATQNPETFTGTFPLPEAELDRFGLSFSIGYPSKEQELEILDISNKQLLKNCSSSESEFVKPVANEKIINDVRNQINQVNISETVKKYIVEIVRATRNHDSIKLGCSPRASVYLQQAARAQAAFNGRTSVYPEDVLFVCPVVLSHRIVLSSYARLEHLTEVQVIKTVCKQIPIPTGI